MLTLLFNQPAGGGTPVTVGGQFVATGTLSGSAHGQARAGAQLVGTSVLSGKATAAVRVGGTLVSVSTLSGKAAGQARTGGQFQGTSAISGLAAAQARAGGQLVGTSALSGKATAAVRVGGTLAAVSALSGAARGQARAGGQLASLSALSGTGHGAAVAGGQFQSASALSGAASVQTPVTVSAPALVAVSTLSGSASVASKSRTVDRADGFEVGGTRMVRRRPEPLRKVDRKPQSKSVTVAAEPLVATSGFGGTARGAANVKVDGFSCAAVLSQPLVKTIQNPSAEEMMAMAFFMFDGAI